MSTFKIALLGDAEVGKTTFMKRFMTGDFEVSYIPTSEAIISHLTLQTNYGPIIFNIWDCSENYNFSEFKDTNAAIVMFDVTNKTSYESVPDWIQKLKRVIESIPVTICGNKSDIEEREVKLKNIHYHRKYNCTYYDISAKSNYNYEKPFLQLARELTGHEDLMFL